MVKYSWQAVVSKREIPDACPVCGASVEVIDRGRSFNLYGCKHLIAAGGSTGQITAEDVIAMPRAWATE